MRAAMGRGMLSPRKRHSDNKDKEKGKDKDKDGNEGPQEESNIQVVCRFRPFNKREQDLGVETSAGIFKLGNTWVKVPQAKGEALTFKVSQVFNLESTQEAVFQVVAEKAMRDLFSGYNSSIFAYGQTGSGKSWTMFGDVKHPPNRGLVPRCTETIFQTIKSGAVRGSVLTIQCSYCEIYQEQITDLLKPENKDLPIREDASKGVYVENLAHEYVSSVVDVYSLMAIGDASKKKCATKMNPNSSRSHCCFSLVLEQTNSEGKKSRAQLNLIDLAGSERVGKTQAMGQSLEEAKKINLSLTALSQVINALADQGGFVPYRSSKLTRLLQNSLGGNSKTSMIVACSPHIDNREETMTSLRFAQRCAQVRNRVKQNTVLTAEQLQAMLDQANKEIMRATGNKKKDIANIKDVGVQTDEAAKLPIPGFAKVEEENERAVSSAASQQQAQQHDRELQNKQLEIDTLTQRLLQANRRLLDATNHSNTPQPRSAQALATSRLAPSALGTPPPGVVASARTDKISEVRRKMSKLRLMASTPRANGEKKKFSISDVRSLKARVVRRVSSVKRAEVRPPPDHPPQVVVDSGVPPLSFGHKRSSARSKRSSGRSKRSSVANASPVDILESDDEEEEEEEELLTPVPEVTEREGDGGEDEGRRSPMPHVPALFKSVEELARKGEERAKRDQQRAGSQSDEEGEGRGEGEEEEGASGGGKQNKATPVRPGAQGMGMLLAPPSVSDADGRERTGTVSEADARDQLRDEASQEVQRLREEKQRHAQAVAAFEQRQREKAQREEREERDKKEREEQEKRDKVEARLKAVEEAQRKRREAEEAREESAEVKLKEQELELLKLRTQMQKGKLAYMELQAELSEAQYSVANLSRQCEQQDTVISRQQDRLTEVEKHLRFAESENADLQDEVKELNAKLSKLQTKLLPPNDDGGASIVKPVQEGSVLSTFRAQQEASQLKNLFDIFSFGGGGGEDKGEEGEGEGEGVGANISKVFSSFNPFG